MACSAGVDRAIGGGKEEAVVLWPGICSTIVSFRYHFILGVSCFLTVCETSPAFSSFVPFSLGCSRKRRARRTCLPIRLSALRLSSFRSSSSLGVLDSEFLASLFVSPWPRVRRLRRVNLRSTSLWKRVAMCESFSKIVSLSRC